MKPRAVYNRLRPPRATTPCDLTPCGLTPSGMRSDTSMPEAEETPVADQDDPRPPCSTLRLAWLGETPPPGSCRECAYDSMISFAVRLST
eukprot:4617884-Pyramimonas_sp.AAC.1